MATKSKKKQVLNKYSKYTSLDSLIDLYWEKKIIFILLIPLGFFLGELYNQNIEKKLYQSKIILKEPPTHIFSIYSKGKESARGLRNNLIELLKINFSSIDLKEEFKEIENKKLDNFKNHNYIKIHKLETDFGYKLIFSNNIDGYDFLSNYVQFIVQKTINEFKQNLLKNIEHSIFIHKNALEIASLINLQEPIVTERETVSFLLDIEDSPFLYYQGEKVLQKQIEHLDKVIVKLKNEQFKWNYILDQPQITILKNNKINNILGMLVGMIVGVVIVYFNFVRKIK